FQVCGRKGIRSGFPGGLLHTKSSHATLTHSHQVQGCKIPPFPPLQRGVKGIGARLSSQCLSYKAPILSPLPPGEGEGEGPPGLLLGRKAPHPNPLPGGEGAGRRCAASCTSYPGAYGGEGGFPAGWVGQAISQSHVG